MGIRSRLKRAVSRVSSTVNNAVDRATGTNLSGNNPTGALAGGDIKRAIQDVSNASMNIAGYTGNQVKNISKGDWANFSYQNQRLIGSSVTLATGGTNRALESSSGQKILRDSYVLKDAAGAFKGAGTLRDSGTISNTDRDAAFRFGSQLALAAGGAYAWSNPVFTAPTGQAITGQQALGYYGASASLPSAPSATQVLVGSTVLGALKKGDFVGAVESATGYDIPDWLGVPQTDSKDPSEFDAWKNQGSNYSGTELSSISPENNLIKYSAYAAAAVLAVLVIKKMRSK